MSNLDKIWVKETGQSGVFSIGLTEDGLEIVRSGSYSIISGNKKFLSGSPLFSVETTETLHSILAPFSGEILNWNATAWNCPEKLTTNDVLCTTRMDSNAMPQL